MDSINESDQYGQYKGKGTNRDSIRERDSIRKMDSIRERDKQGQYKGKGNAFFFWLQKVERFRRSEGNTVFGYKRLSGSEDQKETRFWLQKV